MAYAAVALTATGGVAPYKWTVSAGALPGGLVLGNDGSISGNATSAGTFSFTIQAADTGNSTATLPGVITIAPPLAASLVPSCAQYCQVELGCVSVCGGFGQQSGGVSPYSYTLTQGPLPAGTSLSGLSLTGTFVGQSGYLKFTVQVNDAMGASATIAPTFWMYDHISLASGTCGPGRVSCKVQLPYGGGTPGQQVSASPAGWAGATKCVGPVPGPAPVPCAMPSFSATYQQGTVTVLLTYQQGSIPTYGQMTVQITSSDPCAQGVNCMAPATVTVAG